MEKHGWIVGIFVAAAIVLFGGGLFLIGNQHKAFSDRTAFYAEFSNVSGIRQGANVQVDGMNAGQLVHVEIPSSPAKRFRLKINIDDRLRGLVRKDSVVKIDTQGVVGDKYLEIEGGSEQSPKASAGSTLKSKEPLQLSALLKQAQGIMGQATGTINQVNSTIQDVQGHLDTALNSVTTTVRNTNGLVTDVRHGKGAVGMLLENKQTAAQVQHVIDNTQQATAKLNDASGQVTSILQDVKRRQLVAKVDQTLDSTKSATAQLNQASKQVNTTLKRAFADDQYGRSGGANLRQTLSNLDNSTGNLAEDTEALKHEFFFRGFFKNRGYYNLQHLPADKYRDGKLFKKLKTEREWLQASVMFTDDSAGKEILSRQGQDAIDMAVSRLPELYNTPLVIEGYADQGPRAEQLKRSRHRAALVRAYLQTVYSVEPKNMGIVALSAKPPEDAGKSTYDGVCLVRYSKKK